MNSAWIRCISSRAASASGRPGVNDGSANARAAADGATRGDGSAISISARASASAAARTQSRAASQGPSSSGGGSRAMSTMKLDVTARRVCRAWIARWVDTLPNQSTRSRRTAGSGVTVSVSSLTSLPGRRARPQVQLVMRGRHAVGVHVFGDVADAVAHRRTPHALPAPGEGDDHAVAHATPRGRQRARDGRGREVAARQRVGEALHVGDQAAAQLGERRARAPVRGAHGVDVEQAERGQRLERDPLLRAAPRERRVVRQRRDVFGQRGELEQDRARVALVGRQQVDDRRHLQRRAVAAAVGHRAVGGVEQRLQQRRLVGAHGRQRLLDARARC